MAGETRLTPKLAESSDGKATECGAVQCRAEQEKEELTAHLSSGGVVVVVVVREH